MSAKGGKGGQNLQSTHAKHNANTNLALQAQIQTRQLPQRNGQHPAIKHDANHRIRPRQPVHIDTPARVLAIPLCPKVLHGTTLQRRNKQKHQTVQRSKGDRPPEKPLHSHGREDAYVEEQQRQLQCRHLEKVQNLHDEEEFGKVGNLRRRHGPHIPAYAVWRQRHGVQNGARYAADQRHEREPVIEPEVEVSPDLVGEPLDDEDGGDDAKRVG